MASVEVGFFNKSKRVNNQRTGREAVSVLQDGLSLRAAVGGLLLWVRTADRDREPRAWRILKRQAAPDVHVRDVVHPRAEFFAQK